MKAPAAFLGWALLALAVPQSTRCEVVYSGPQNLHLSAGSTLSISICNSPQAWDDVNLQVVYSPGRTSTRRFSNLDSGIEFLSDPQLHNAANRFGVGELVDSSGYFGSSDYIIFAEFTVYYTPDGAPGFTSSFGEFCDQTGYAGFRMVNGANTYYGWMQLGVQNYQWASINAVVIDWAYDDSPGVPIMTEAAPEPSVAALLLVSALSLGVIRLRSS
jgi:hypothetical protein